MKKNIHPEYKDCTVTCACGETFIVQSSKDQVQVEVCSKCHPFFTGNEKNRKNHAGNIDKFNKKYGYEN